MGSGPAGLPGLPREQQIERWGQSPSHPLLSLPVSREDRERGQPLASRVSAQPRSLGTASDEGPEQAAGRKQGPCLRGGTPFQLPAPPRDAGAQSHSGKVDGRAGGRPVLHELSHTAHSMAVRNWPGRSLGTEKGPPGCFLIHSGGRVRGAQSLIYRLSISLSKKKKKGLFSP